MLPCCSTLHDNTPRRASSVPRGWLHSIVMIFSPVPMDPVLGLLTIERLELPAVGVSKSARDLALGGCAKETLWPGIGAPSWVLDFGVHGLEAHRLEFNVSAEFGICVSARARSIDLRRGLDDMPRVRLRGTRHLDTVLRTSASNCKRVPVRDPRPFSQARRPRARLELFPAETFPVARGMARSADLKANRRARVTRRAATTKIVNRIS
jgi:hypothetical protein